MTIMFISNPLEQQLCSFPNLEFWMEKNTIKKFDICLYQYQRRVHSEKLHSTLNSKAKGGLGLVHSTPYEVVEWGVDWISDGVECS